MAARIPPRSARLARLGVSTLFFANGATAASILPRLPAIKDNLHLSNGELGAAAAMVALGGLIAGGLVGVLIGRFGSGRLAWMAGTLNALMLIGVAVSGSWLGLAAAYLVMGMFDATMDASMNAHGIGVQRVYGRSILQGFHGQWSLGSMTGGAVGAVAAGIGLPVSTHLVGAAVALGLAVVVAARWLLPSSVADAHDEVAEPPEPLRLAHAGRLLRILVPIALLGILCVQVQNAAANWSAIYLRDILGQPEGIAASGYVVFMAAMVAGRLTNDRWVDRWGVVTVVRSGAVVGMLAITLVIVSGPAAMAPLALVGFALIGIGSSSMFPVMIGAAGSRPGIPPRHGVALVSWFARVGLIVAPSLVGAAADAWGLGAALAFPLAAAVAIAVFTPVLTGGPFRRVRDDVAPAAV
jgi:fucose permease